MTGQLVRFEPRATLRVANLTRGTLRPHAAAALRERRPGRERLPFAAPPRRPRGREPMPLWLAYALCVLACVVFGYAAGRAF